MIIKFVGKEERRRDKSAVWCKLCGGSIRCTAKDPVVAATSLGNGLFHYECAKKKWRKISESLNRGARGGREVREDGPKGGIVLPAEGDRACGEPDTGGDPDDS